MLAATLSLRASPGMSSLSDVGGAAPNGLPAQQLCSTDRTQHVKSAYGHEAREKGASAHGSL
jgi:hypothetical protein